MCTFASARHAHGLSIPPVTGTPFRSDRSRASKREAATSRRYPGRCIRASAGPGLTTGTDAPAAPGKMPVVGHLLKIDLKNIATSTETLFKEGGEDLQAMTLSLFGTDGLHTRDPQDCQHILVNHDAFPKAANMSEIMENWLGNGLATTVDLPNHKVMRRLLTPMFRADYIQGLTPAFSEIGDKLADCIIEQGEYDMQELAKRATIDVIGITGFRTDFGSLDLAAGKRSSPGSVDTGDGEMDVAKMFDQLTNGAGNLFAFARLSPKLEWIPGYTEYVSAVKRLDAVIDAAVAERRREGVKPTDLDLISFCVRQMEEDPSFMSDKRIRDELHTMLFAGSDTTANTLSWMFWKLAENPSMLDRCIAEADALYDNGGNLSPDSLNRTLPFLTACFTEALRLFPPAPVLARTCEKDSVLPGTNTLVKAGEGVFIQIWSAQRNPKVFDRADEFCPERWLPEGEEEFGKADDDTLLAFGGGPRVCIGKYFAIMEAQVIASRVLRKARVEAVPGFKPEISLAVTLTSANGIKLRAVPR